MYNLAIRKCTSPPLLAPRLKIFKLKLNPGPAEPKADMLPSEPARRAARNVIVCKQDMCPLSVTQLHVCQPLTLFLTLVNLKHIYYYKITMQSLYQGQVQNLKNNQHTIIQWNKIFHLLSSQIRKKIILKKLDRGFYEFRFYITLKYVKVSPLQAMKAHAGCGCKGSHIHSHGTRKR